VHKIESHNKDDGAEMCATTSRLTTFSKQLLRCKQWDQRLCSRNKLSPTARSTHTKLNGEAAVCVLKSLDLTNAFEAEISKMILDFDGSHPSHILNVKRLVAHFEKRVHDELEAMKMDDSEQEKSLFLHDRFHTKAYRFVASSFSPPITFLRRTTRGPDGQEQGSFATCPSEIDSILRDAWQQIYNGTSKSLHELADGFMTKYSQYLLHAPEYHLGDIQPEAFRHACMTASNTAGGLDGWDPIDFKLLSPHSFCYLADLLNAIELGAPWPDGLTQGRLAFLAKDPTQAEDPMSYRPLLVLPHLYRRWAAHRLQCLPGWIDSWANDSMFAGIPDKGAEDAWWLSSVTMESWQAKGIPFSGSSADIAKCFDQMVRPLVYAIAKAAGMPMRVLEPYQRFMEGMSVRNTISDCLGEPYVRRCGIPQGCPLSMMFLAFVYAHGPWPCLPSGLLPGSLLMT
jgi:hypothetical protein